MTDYNDGKWHGFNGGECPVHPLTEVQCVLQGRLEHPADIAGSGDVMNAECWHWNVPRDRAGAISAFRVLKEYREPREFWIVAATGDAWETEARAKTVADGLVDPTIIHVREVLE